MPIESLIVFWTKTVKVTQFLSSLKFQIIYLNFFHQVERGKKLVTLFYKFVIVSS